MKLKKIISAFLAFLMIATSVAMLVGCNGDGEQESGEDPVESTGGNDQASDRQHNVPKKNFKGETFNSLNFEINTSQYYYFTDEEAAGDPIKEALWQRTELITEYLNCELTFEQMTGDRSIGVSQYMYDQVMAGTDDYQQIIMHPIYGVSSMVNNGYSYDFAALPNVDLDAEWWDKDDMDDLRLGTAYPYGRSDFMISAPHVVMFNKTMIDDKQMENPYDLVNNMQWTLDTMMSMAKAAAHDVNNDNTYDPVEDTFGISTSELSKFNSFLMSCDQPISQRDENGKVEMALNTEKTIKIIEKFYDLWMTNGAVFVAAVNNNSGINDQHVFGEGRSLFELYDLSFLEAMRDYEVDAGIVPYPMYDEDQDAYYSMDWGPTWCIPATITNPELVGSVVELYSFYSANTIIPAYYDKVLEGKLTNDLESRKMLDLIFESVSFDPVNNYFGFHSGIGDLAFIIGRLVIEKSSSNFSSFYKERENTAKNVIHDFYKNLKKNGLWED